MRGRRRTWMLGGSGLIACGVVGMLGYGLVGGPGAAVASVASSVVAGLLEARSPEDAAVWTTYGYLSLFLPIAVALIAGVQIARARVVELPWRWAPLWVLALQAMVWAIPQIGFAAVGPGSDVQAFVASLSVLGMLGFLANTLGLGILAVVLATRQRPDTVEVFRSA